MLGHVGIGAHGQPDVVGLVGAAGEDLGPVDDVLVAVAHGPGAQRGQVGAGFGLGVADGEVQLAGQDLGQEERLLLVGAVAHDRRADGVDGDEGERRPGPPGLVEEDELVGGRPTLPAELGRPADAEPAVLADLAHDLAPGLAALAALGQSRPHLVGQQLGVVPAAARHAAAAVRGSLRGTCGAPSACIPCGPCRSRPLWRKTVTRSRFRAPVGGFSARPRPPGSEHPEGDDEEHQDHREPDHEPDRLDRAVPSLQEHQDKNQDRRHPAEPDDLTSGHRGSAAHPISQAGPRRVPVSGRSTSPSAAASRPPTARSARGPASPGEATARPSARRSGGVSWFSPPRWSRRCLLETACSRCG